MEPLRPLCGQQNLRDLTGIRVCVTMHWIDRFRTPSRSHCLPKRSWKSLLHAAAFRKDCTTVFPSAARTVLTSLCLAECIIASATSRTLTSGNWTSWQRDSLRKLQADDEQDHDDGEQQSISISRSDVKRSLQGSQGKHSPVLRLPQVCRTDPESTARCLTRSKVDRTVGDWCLFCQQARKKVKGVSIKLLQVA